jgi:hypothetical protein
MYSRLCCGLDLVLDLVDLTVLTHLVFLQRPSYSGPLWRRLNQNCDMLQCISRLGLIKANYKQFHMAQVEFYISLSLRKKK